MINNNSKLNNNNNNNKNLNYNNHGFYTAKIQSIKLKGFLNFNPKFKFDLKYPDNIIGVLDSTEFNNTIQSINNSISSKLPSTFYIFLIPIFLGILIIIAGLNSSLLYFGIAFTSLGILSLIITILFFQNNVEEKIINQLRIINQKYRERIIIWSLHTEIVYKPVDPYLYQLNKNKLSFKSQLVYDDSGQPYSTSKDMYLLIAFPTSYSQNYNSNQNNLIDLEQLSSPHFQLPIFDIIPNYENFNYSSINNSNSNHNLSISMNIL